MSYSPEKLSTAGGQAAKGVAPQQFSYKNSDDAIADMLASGYFDEAAYQMDADDMISIVASDGIAIFRVSSSDPVAQTVAINSNIISDQGGANNSASFKSIYRLEDFAVQDETTITLENGINYLVYIPSPVTSSKSFILEGTYADGGSMIYMGGEGLLQWNYASITSGDSWLENFLNPGGPFTLKGFSVQDINLNMVNGVNIEGTTVENSWTQVTVRDCVFIDFQRAIQVEKVLKIDIQNVDAFHPGITLDSNTIHLHEVQEALVADCHLQHRGSLIAPLSVKPEFTSTGVSKILIRDCTFDLPAGHRGAANIPIYTQGTGVITFSNCVAQGNDGSNVPGLITIDMGNIASIEEGATGQLKITTKLPHILVATNPITLFGSLDYDIRGVNVQASPAPTSTTFEIAGTYGDDNFAGSYLYGSLNPYSSPEIIASGGSAFETPVPMGAAVVTNSSETQDIAVADTLQKITFATAGEIQLPFGGIPKDFIISDYNDLELQYIGKTVLNARAKFTVTIPNGTVATGNIIFRYGSGPIDTAPFEWYRDVTPREALSYEAMVRLQPGDIIFPMIEATSTENVTMKSIVFTVTKA